MPGWLQILIALGALVVLAPLVAWFGLHHGRKVKGALALAAFLGFAVVYDQPSKHRIEAQNRAPEEEEGAGDPPKV